MSRELLFQYSYIYPLYKIVKKRFLKVEMQVETDFLIYKLLPKHLLQ